jgi:hypothetical protein
MYKVTNLYTHVMIADETGIGLAKVQAMGRAGLLGKAVIKFPAHYRPSALKKALAVGDERIKLSDDDIAEIRERKAIGETGAALAAEFGVDGSYISRLVRGERRLEQ